MKNRKGSIILTMLVVALSFFIACNQVQAVELDPITGDPVNPNAREAVANTKGEDTQELEQATGIFDTKVADGVYKFSENKTPYLPFIRYATDRILMDKEIGGIGTSFSGKSLEVTAPLKGLQVLASNDTVRISSDMEYGVIYASQNVIIDGHISKPVIVFAGGSITIGENAVLEDDIICYTNEMIVNGTIKGSIVGATEKTVINGVVEKDVRVQTNAFTASKAENIKGQIYVETYNKDINMQAQFPNATVKVLETKARFNISMVTNGIVTCLLFTLLFMIVEKVSKKNILGSTFVKVKDHPFFTFGTGALLIVLCPIIATLLILLSAMGLYAVAIPAFIIYVAGIIVIGLLSTFIVGAVLAKYMKEHYFKEKSIALNIVGTFFVFASLYVLARIPVISGYVTMALVIFAIGFVMTAIFKKEKITKS